MSEEQKEAAQTEREKAMDAKVKEVANENEKRKVDSKDKEGNAIKVFPKGLLLRAGMTRGKNPQVISYEAFDLSQPETLPVSLEEFMALTETKDEKILVSYLIDGFNDSQYTQASDPIAEYVEASWPEDVQKQFRLVVRNYSNATKVSIEDAVALIKPGIVASQSKK